MEQETDLVAELNRVQNETAVKEHFKITRQQLRREAIRMRKDKRSKFKEAAMRAGVPGGGATMRELPEL